MHYHSIYCYLKKKIFIYVILVQFHLMNEASSINLHQVPFNIIKKFILKKKIEKKLSSKFSVNYNYIKSCIKNPVFEKRWI